MGVPISEVGYIPAMPRREDHEVHKGLFIYLFIYVFMLLLSRGYKINTLAFIILTTMLPTFEILEETNE